MCVFAIYIAENGSEFNWFWSKNRRTMENSIYKHICTVYARYETAKDFGHSINSHAFSLRNVSIYVTCAKKHEKNDDNDKNNITLDCACTHIRTHIFSVVLYIIKRSL